MKLLYNNNDIIGYENKWDEISEGKYGNKFYNGKILQVSSSTP